MTIKLRGDTYWLDCQIKGQRVRESLKTGDKKQAQKAADIRRGELWRQRVLGERQTHTMAQAFDRWLIEKADKKSIETDILRIGILKPKLGSKVLDAIDRAAVERAIPADVKPATRNRYRAIIRAILRAAERDWDWIEKAPIIKAEKERNKRETFITREQADKLMEALPAHYRPAVKFAFMTGLRRANILGLHWEAVNLDAGVVMVAADQSKSGKRIIVPLNASAKFLLQVLPGREGKVFAMTHITRSTWVAACKKAGIEGFRFHDIRHTWASWHAMAGTSMQVLQELGGWASHSMVQRYVTFAPSHLASAAEAVSL